MFVGHYGVFICSQSVGPRVPLWVWFLAVQWMDVVSSIMVFSGIEKLHIVPVFTEANAYDLLHALYPRFAWIDRHFVSPRCDSRDVCFRQTRAMTIFLVAAASFPHWLLDLIVHVPDLPLYDNMAKVGFGLWRRVTLSFPLELIVLGLGAWLYARMTKFTSANGQYLYWGFVAVLAALQVYANFGRRLRRLKRWR